MPKQNFVTVPGRYVPVAVNFPEVSTQAYLWQHKYNIFTFLSSNLLNDKAIQHLSFNIFSKELMQGMENLYVDTRPKILQVITINAPLILIVREVFFMFATHIVGDFEGFFEGTKTFLASKLS